MNILQCGVPKSGNFWLYKIIQQILKRNGHSTTSFIEREPVFSLAKDWELNFPEQARIDVLDATDLQFCYRISSIFRMLIDDIRAYVNQSPHIWSHSPVCKKSEELLNFFSKKIYIIRDPRDMAVSAAKYYCSDYMLKYFPQEHKEPKRFLNKNFDQLMQDWVWHVFDYLRLSRKHKIHIAFFERFLMDFQQELSRLLDYLEVGLSSTDREALEEAVSFERLKKKNPKHLKKGESGYWKGLLTDEQAERATMIAGPLISYFNYPLEREQSMTFDPDKTLEDPEELKQAIIKSQKPLYE